MFGLTLTTCQLIQGPAVRTWNCVAHFANLLWYKFNHVRHPIMPRQRRRHHSRSRSRSRSHSYDRDREPKRRKIESFESPQHKRSLSPHLEEDLKHNSPPPKENEQFKMDMLTKPDVEHSISTDPNNTKGEPLKPLSETDIDPKREDNGQIKVETTNAKSDSGENSFIENKSQEDSAELETTLSNESLDNVAAEVNTSQESDIDLTKDGGEIFSDEDLKTDKKSVIIAKVSDSKITPKKTLSPKQVQKRFEIEKRREEQRVEREKKKQQLLEEKLKNKEERERLKQEKQEHKQKESELKEEKKKKEREEKEQKRKEKEEKIEQKRKEKEEKDEQKRKEQEEKNKEKQKLQEKKQKAAAVFVNFFTKKNDSAVEEKKSDDDVISLTFMPFEVKSDMRLAPITRIKLTDEQRNFFDVALKNKAEKLYLEELKEGRKTGKQGKTWPAEESSESDDVIIVEDMNPGESIEEQPLTVNKLKAKFLRFNDNRRPAYFGTWRKKSKFIKPCRPLALDKDIFDYEYDSDEDWEEEEDAGESLRGSDDEDKENDSENEYEVDNEFFVPHGHLSDDEVNDEDVVISPEAHKAKLKLLKKEFEEEMQGKTQKIKPRVIGCIWYNNKERNSVDNAIYEFLRPLSIISNGPVMIKKRNEFILQTSQRSSLGGKPLGIDLIPDFLKIIHGNTNNNKKVITEFHNLLKLKNVEVSKASLKRQWRQFADWIKCPEEGPMLNKHCWYVRNEVKEEYNVNLVLPSK